MITAFQFQLEKEILMIALDRLGWLDMVSKVNDEVCKDEKVFSSPSDYRHKKINEALTAAGLPEK